MNPNLISPEKMRQLIGGYARLKELGQSKIINPRDEGEKKGLHDFVTNAMLEHAEEFFGCWVAVRQGYEPLITGFADLMARAAQRHAANQPKTSEDKPNEQPAN